MEIQEYQQRSLLVTAMEIGMKKASIELGHDKPYISQTDAYKKYVEALVRRWVQEKRINKIKTGQNTSKVNYEKIHLEIAFNSYNLCKTVLS